MRVKIKFKAKSNSNVYLQEPFLSELNGYKMEYDKESCSGILTLPKGQTRLPPIFAEKDYIVSVELPEGLKEIGKFAFSGCKSLKDVFVSRSVEKIGELTFHNCTALEKVFVESECVLEEEMFAGCTSLKEIEISSQTSPFSFKGRNHSVFYPDCKITRHLCNGVDVFYKGEASKAISKIFDDTGLKTNISEFVLHDLNDGFIDVFLLIDEEELTEDFKKEFYCSDYAEIVVFILHESSAKKVLEKAKNIFSPKDKDNKFNLSVIMFPKKFPIESRTDQLNMATFIINNWGFSHTWHEHLSGGYLGNEFLFLSFYGGNEIDFKIKINPKTDFVLSCPHVPPMIMLDCSLSNYEDIRSENWRKYEEIIRPFEKQKCKVRTLDVLDASTFDTYEVENFLFRKV